MFGPMFLLPAISQNPSPNKLDIQYYLDGQSIGGVIYDIKSIKGKNLTITPRLCAHNSPTITPVETDNLSYPIADFDSWSDQMGTPYQNMTIPQQPGWVTHDLTAFPLGTPKGALCYDRDANPTGGYAWIGISLSVDGGPGRSSGCYFYETRATYSSNTYLPYPKVANILNTTQTSLTGRYITMTVELGA